MSKSFRERVGEVIGGYDSEAVSKEIASFEHEIARMKQAIQYLTEDAYLDGPYALSPKDLLQQLSEYDSQFIDELIQDRLWDTLGGIGYGAFDTEMARGRAIQDSRRMWVYSPLAQWSITTWTNFGLGDSVSIVPTDPNAVETWEKFWESEQNDATFGDDNIQELSNWTLIDGNTFLAFFASKVDGEVIVEEIPCDEIKEIVTHPHRKSQELFYKREFMDSKKTTKTLYYPSWSARFSEMYEKFIADEEILPQGAKRADQMMNGGEELTPEDQEKVGTDVCVLHIMFNRKDRKSRWGWPLLTSASPYVRAHKRFMEDRLTVSASKAMFTRRKKVKGGSRAVSAVKSTLQSTLSMSNYQDTNAPPGAGSIEIDNAAVDTTDLPMTTGASDAKTDHEMFAWMALIGAFLFPTTAGLDTSRWATALAMDKTLAMQWSRYQTFWTAQFRKVVEIVLRFTEMYSPDAPTFESYKAQINIDTLSIVDFPQIVTSLSVAVRDMLLPFEQDGTIPIETARAILRELWLVMLQALGITAADEVTEKALFGIEKETVEMTTPAIKAVLAEMKKELQKEHMSQEALQFIEALGSGNGDRKLS